MRESVSGFLHRKNWRGTLTAQGKCQPPKPGKCCRTWDLGDLGRELGRKELSCRIPFNIFWLFDMLCCLFCCPFQSLMFLLPCGGDETEAGGDGLMPPDFQHIVE